MPTANEEWFDAMVRHQVGLLRVAGSIRNDITEILNATEEDIASRIRDRLERAPDEPLPRSLERASVLQRIINNTRTKAWDEIDEKLVKEMEDLAKREPRFMNGTMQSVAPVDVGLTLPDTDRLMSIAKSQPFQGKALKEWSKQLRQEDLDRIQSQIKIGITQGETSKQIARRVVGTKAAKGKDGITQITRNQAAAVTRTAVNHVANGARKEMMQANKQVFRRERYVATLDARTTPICRSLDGKKYDVTKGPYPPLHVNCRSIRIAEISGAELADRPAKASTEKQLVREYNRANGTSATRRADLPRGHKGSFDTFKRQRVRELTGQLPGKTTYQEFLSRQSAEFQDDVLGPTKAKLFRKGNLSLDKYVDRKGGELTLSQLARREAEAFRQAGLDPEEFL